MMRRMIALLLAASALCYVPGSGGTASPSARGQQARDGSPREAKDSSGSPKRAPTQRHIGTSALANGTQAVNIIHHPPDGWTTPVNISNLPTESNLPSIAVDVNGKVYATWGNGSTTSAFRPSSATRPPARDTSPTMTVTSPTATWRSGSSNTRRA
jgi:hypothetical protein